MLASKWLASAIMCNCYFVGDFKLSNGKRDSNYIDLWHLLTNRSYVVQIAREMLHETEGLRYNVVGGPASAALPIADAMMYIGSILRPDIFIERTFMVRREFKPHGMERKIEGLVIKGDSALVVEDVVASGESIAHAINELMKIGVNVVGAFTVVDRQEGASELLVKEFNIVLRSLVTLSDLVKREVKEY